MLYFSKLNSIYYYTFNDIKYLSDIDFKGQIRNSQKMVYLILGHPVYIEFLRDFLLEFEIFLSKIAYDDFESYLIPFSILETKKSPVNKLVIFHFLNHTQNLIMI